MSYSSDQLPNEIKSGETCGNHHQALSKEHRSRRIMGKRRSARSKFTIIVFVRNQSPTTAKNAKNDHSYRPIPRLCGMTRNHKFPSAAREDKDQEAKAGSKETVENKHQLFGKILHACSAQRPKLSDPAQGTRRLQPRRWWPCASTRVRSSA